MMLLALFIVILSLTWTKVKYVKWIFQYVDIDINMINQRRLRSSVLRVEKFSTKGWDIFLLGRQSFDEEKEFYLCFPIDANWALQSYFFLETPFYSLSFSPTWPILLWVGWLKLVLIYFNSQIIGSEQS